MSKKWESYEEVANYLLDRFAAEFGIDCVQGKQKIIGAKSGTNWEVDGKGVRGDGESFVIVECRRYTKSKQTQEKMAALAYRIKDAGADGGIIVSPLGLQEGAAKIAAAEKIVDVHLSPDATNSDYVMKFLNKIMIGVSDTINLNESVSETLTISIVKKDGGDDSGEI